ncbi:hypothetical protein L1987_67757 [Smallanthus sonchifolius]|uniref:Uncharacterized protein n=1 Tax=Smallanthus sonchifolius TaxID=185202 RepID=A0ACB9B438_9ASTR|nr:hypothetical protein L1987_67757 [Smallanthus sonchifolius]
MASGKIQIRKIGNLNKHKPSLIAKRNKKKGRKWVSALLLWKVRNCRQFDMGLGLMALLGLGVAKRDRVGPSRGTNTGRLSLANGMRGNRVTMTMIVEHSGRLHAQENGSHSHLTIFLKYLF